MTKHQYVRTRRPGGVSVWSQGDFAVIFGPDFTPGLSRRLDAVCIEFEKTVQALVGSSRRIVITVRIEDEQQERVVDVAATGVSASATVRPPEICACGSISWADGTDDNPTPRCADCGKPWGHTS